MFRVKKISCVFADHPVFTWTDKGTFNIWQ